MKNLRDGENYFNYMYNLIKGGEAKSIFKVLCKKYRQESLKPFSSWQLFESLRFIDEKNEEVANKTE